VVTVHNFSYGLINPALAYLVSCLGAFLGLRCLTRARAHDRHGRAGWLSAAAFAVGACGIWAMHFIAMLGFTIPGQQISYNVPLTIASMVLAAAVVGVGLFIVGYGDGSWPRLVTAGVIVGLGVASMHYMGMAAMSMTDSMSYSPGLFGLSVLIAVVAGTAALWIGTWVRGLTATFAASLIMGVAVNGMHYTGMAALRVTKGTAGMPGMQVSGSSASSFVVPLVFGISLVALVLTLVVSLARTEEEIAEDALIDQRLQAAASREPIRAGIVKPATSARQAPGQPSAFTKAPAMSNSIQPSAFTKAPAMSNSVQPSAFTKAPASSQPSAFTKAPPSGPPAAQPEYPADRGAGAPPPVDPLVTRVPGASGRRSAPPPVR
jgi:NO-binding membrane sensor protein with MHYT domain